jgi:hypothetical protein
MINKKLGYYVVDQSEFDSKIQACIYATTNNKDVKWVFNKEIFDRYSWHIEPELTLDQLYDKRARELREKYDYILISYSGGADSHNLLMSFIRQSLYVDEIIINTVEKGSKKNIILSSRNTAAEDALLTEHHLQALPRIREIQKLCPNTKINVLDLTDYLFDMFDNSGDASWILNKREKLNPINVTRFNYLYFSEIRKQFDRDKKIAVVLGVEKPRIYINSDNVIYTRFTDGAANIVSVISDHMREYPNATIEYFYWSPDATDIICKQVHIVKKWLNLRPENQTLWMGRNLTNEVYRLHHERIYRTLLYTTWNSNWFQADKAIKDWYTEFDNWFIEGHKGTQHYNIWSEGLKFVEHHASKYIKYADGIPDGLTMFFQDHRVCNLNEH